MDNRAGGGFSYRSKYYRLRGGYNKIAHPPPLRRAFYTQMNKNSQIWRGGRVVDYAAAAMEQMELYCTAHPGSPSAARQPRLFVRGELWIALLGPSVEEGIVGIGSTVVGALRAFDSQYLAGFRPPSEPARRRRSFRNAPAQAT